MTTVPTVMIPSAFELEVDPTGGTTFAAVKQVKGFDLGNVEADELDITSFTGSSDWRAFAQGMKQATDGSFTIQYLIDDTQHKALRDGVGSSTAMKFRATLTAANADDEIITFDALIKSMSRPIEISGVLEATIGFKMTGAPVYTTTP